MSPAAVSERRALLVATDRYAHPKLSNLSTPSQDVEALSRVLTDRAIGNFHVDTLVNEPAQRVREAIEDLYADRHLGDVLLLYFSGHGVTDLNSRLYFAMADTRPERLLSTAVPDKFVLELLETTRSKRNLLILDCCFSGAFATDLGIKGDASIHPAKPFAGASAKGTVILTASDSTEFAFEGQSKPIGAQLSIFTRHIVEGLRTGKADLDWDGEIAADELYEYVRRRVVEELPNQRPGMSSQQQHGRLVIASSLRALGKLPREVDDALKSSLPDVRLAGVKALSNLMKGARKESATAAGDRLREMLHDKSQLVSDAAALALGLVLVQDTPPTEGGAPSNMASVSIEKAPDPLASTDVFSITPHDQDSRNGRLSGPVRLLRADRLVGPGRWASLLAGIFVLVFVVGMIVRAATNTLDPQPPGPTSLPTTPTTSPTASPSPDDPFKQLRSFSVAAALPACVEPELRKWRFSSRELQCEFREGSVVFDQWPDQTKLNGAFEFLKNGNPGATEEPWVYQGEREGRKLEYYSAAERWSTFWTSEDLLVSGQASHNRDDPIAARNWWHEELEELGPEPIEQSPRP